MQSSSPSTISEQPDSAISTSSSAPVNIRLAQKQDVENIYQLLNPYVDSKVLLQRTREQILRDIALTWVVEFNNTIAGVSNLTFFQSRLAEVRGLAIAPMLQGKKAGSALLNTMLNYIENNSLEPRVTVFALTYTTPFFEKLGFKIVEKEKFGEKILEVCRFCARQNDCKEIAVEKIVYPHRKP